ncbi:MAG: polymerase, sigma-24 subunit, subfamily [Myxococcaceae bacterium]|nr:polymerase, sigma-24 subunit, subfamily [Myxococcaceae bacterium]
MDIVAGRGHLRVADERGEALCAMPRSVSETANEQALMAAYIAGDERAFSALFDALAPRLLAFFQRAVNDRAVAEDLLQITFERVHAARERYRLGSPVRPWLFTIAARVRVDELRRRYRLPASADESELDRVPASAPLADDPEQLDQRSRDLQVRQALDKLPASQRVVVHLHRFEGMSFGEIGSVLGAQEGAVRLRAFRAYETLRTLLLPLMSEGETS